MASFTQANRLLTVDTPLGPDVFLLLSMAGTEGISRLFQFHLELLSADANIHPKDIVGKNVTWTVGPAGQQPRLFNGVVSRFVAGGRHLYDLRSYSMEVVPWLWFLTRTSNCRVFHEPKRNVPEIIQTIFDEHGFTDYEPLPAASYPKRDYTVQYRESSFNFVSRLMEDEGIFYFFKHESGKHTLVMADSNTAFVDCPQKEVPYATGSRAVGHISAWDHGFEFRSGKYTARHYNFETPSTDLLASADTLIAQPDAGKYERYDYPGGYLTGAEGQNHVKLRMEEEEAAYQTVQCASDCATFTPAGKFTLTEHIADGQAGKVYAITAIEHTAKDVNYGTTESPAEYGNRFTCIPATVTYRPPCATRKPTVQGLQTAVVVGPPKEEIYTDKHGRIKVQFHWDREGRHDEKSSCWIRVASIWAGKGYGIINTPRVGQEVVVDFLEGDPDQPLVIGSVYNADQTPPTGLPKAKMVGGLRSNSYPGGGGYNSLTFDDTKGKEMVALHAQYDLTATVEHDDTQTVHNNRTITVDGTHTETIQKDTTITIVEGMLAHDVAGNMASYHVKGNLIEQYDANQDTTVGDNQSTSVQQTINVTSEKANIHVQAATKIEIVVGKSSLVMDADGNIDLKGVKLTINGSDSIALDGAKITITGGEEAKMGVGGQTVVCDKSKVATSGAAISTSAVGVHELTGGIIKLN